MYHAFLIAAQFVLSAVLVLSTAWAPLPTLEIATAIPGIGLAVWAWFAMGLRRLRIGPGTTEHTRLVQHGPYAIVRHPMYAGLLWFTATLLFTPLLWWRVVSWLALIGVLLAKALAEELAMARRFDEYADYRARVGRLFPKFSLVKKRV